MSLDILTYFEQRFGIHKSVFSEFRLYSDQKGRILLGPKNLIEGRLIVSMGMQIARTNGDIKPSTNFLQLFGKHVTKNAISLTKEQIQAYLKGEDIHLSGKVDATDGYVLLKYLNHPLACGLLKGTTLKEGERKGEHDVRLPAIVRNVLPKARRCEIKFL